MLRNRRRRNRIAFAVALAFVLIAFGLAWQFIRVSAQIRDAQARGADLAMLRRAAFPPGYPTLSDAPTVMGAGDNFNLIWQHHDPYFNWTDGLRNTSYQPQVAAHTIWLFGNSSLESGSLPDDWTIASRLQKLIGHRYKVVNLGHPAYTRSQEDRLLQVTDVRPGDLVIFYDGVPEVGTIWISRERHNLPTADTCEPEASAVAITYKNIGLNAERYAIARGAMFLQVLQPTLFSRTLTNLDARIASDMGEDAKNWSLQACYPALTRAIKSRGLDFTHISLPDNWWDTTHGGYLVNAAVARALFDALTLI